MSRVVQTAHDLEKKWRSTDVQLKTNADFSSLHLKDRVLAGLKKAGYKTPSPIQALAIPPGIFGKDLLVQAKSGTGKTLVFAVIALQSLLEIKYPQVLIMVPTREIAVQVRDCIRAVGCGIKGLKCCSFIGGLPISDDEENVVGCQIIVGTPGRLKQLISIGFLKTNSIRLLVLDEADNLIEHVFINDLNFIFQSLPKAKQVIATSATYPNELRNFIRHYFRMNVFKARLNKKDLALVGMIHYIKIVPQSKLPLVAYKLKLATLEKILSSVNFTQCLVFCNLKSIVESLCCDIRNWGFTTTYISANKEQHDRLKAIDNLKRFRCKVLVSSDVTARGIDAENVDLVINFDKPFKEETYFHRCGRAGRYGSKGVAITLLVEDEEHMFKTTVENKNFHLYILPDRIPKNLINIRPLQEKPKKDSSDIEEQKNSVDTISNVIIQDNSKVSSNKENTVHISEVELIEQDKESLFISDIENNKECCASNNILYEQHGSEKCVISTLNGLTSNNSEQANKDLTTLSPVESSCKNEANDLLIEKQSEVNDGKNDCLPSCNPIKGCIADASEQGNPENLEDSFHNSLLLPSNMCSESETLNMIEQNIRNFLESDIESECFELEDENACKKRLEALLLMVDSTDFDQIIYPAPAESTKVVHFSELQKSVVKFLVDYEVKYDSENIRDSNQCEALCDSMPSNAKQDFNFKCDNAINEKYKNIRKDLADFYHKIYKSYQVQSIDEGLIKDFKASLIAQDNVKEKTTEITKDKIDTLLSEHNYAKTPPLEQESNSKTVTKRVFNKKLDIDSSDSNDSIYKTSKRNKHRVDTALDGHSNAKTTKLEQLPKSVPEKLLHKESDTDSDSSDSSDSVSSKNNLKSNLNVDDQSFANYIFKGPLVSKSTSRQSSDSSGDKHLNKTLNKFSDTTDSSSEESFCSSSWRLQSKVFKVSNKCPLKPSHQNKMDISPETFLKQEIDASKNIQGVKKKTDIKKKNLARNEYSCRLNSKNEKGTYLSKSLLEESSDSDSAKHFSGNTFNKLINSSSESESSFGSGSWKIGSKKYPKPFLANKSKNYDIPPRTFLKQEVDTSKNRQIDKKVYPKSNLSKNEYFHQHNSKNESYLCTQRHNGKKSKGVKTFHRTATPTISDASYQQDFNESAFVSKNQEQKKAFRNNTHGNSWSYNYGEGTAQSYQHYDYFPASVITNQVPVLQSVYSNHQCSCCRGNISSNNIPGDMYDIFLKQWKFIQNFSS